MSPVVCPRLLFSFQTHLEQLFGRAFVFTTRKIKDLKISLLSLLKKIILYIYIFAWISTCPCYEYSVGELEKLIFASLISDEIWLVGPEASQQLSHNKVIPQILKGTTEQKHIFLFHVLIFSQKTQFKLLSDFHHSKGANFLTGIRWD